MMIIGVLTMHVMTRIRPAGNARLLRYERGPSSGCLLPL